MPSPRESIQTRNHKQDPLVKLREFCLVVGRNHASASEVSHRGFPGTRAFYRAAVLVAQTFRQPIVRF